MKLFSKIAVVAAALLLVSVFTGCNNSSSGSGPETLAVFEGTSGRYACTLTCFEDDSWDLDIAGTPLGDFTYAKGTYEGDPTKDGTFDYVIKQYVPYEVMMEQGKTTLTTIPGGEAHSTTVTNGRITLITEMGSATLVRK